MKSYEQFRAGAPVSVGAVAMSAGVAVVVLAVGVLFSLIGFGHAGLAASGSALDRAMFVWGGASVFLCVLLLFVAVRRRSFLLLMIAASVPLWLGLAAIYVVLRVAQ